MKRKCAIILFALVAAAVSSLVDADTSTSAYVRELDNIAAHCTLVTNEVDIHVMEMQLKGGVEAMHSHGKHKKQLASKLSEKVSKARQDGYKEITDCIVNAKLLGAKAYKQHAAATKDAGVRHDMKRVLTAWLAYFPDEVLSPHLDGLGDHSRDAASQVEKIAYNKAVSVLESDQLTR